MPSGVDVGDLPARLESGYLAAHLPKATSTYADAFDKSPEFYSFYRSLEAYRASFAGKSNVLVVDPSSDFFSFMKDAGGAPRN